LESLEIGAFTLVALSTEDVTRCKQLIVQYRDLSLEPVIDLSPDAVASWSHEHDKEVVSERCFGCRVGVPGSVPDPHARGRSAARLLDARPVQRHALRGQDGVSVALLAA